ncbi:MAG: DUF6629 family protein [Chitinophagaceae bacterium]
MCFSATASFGAGMALSAAGAVAMAKAKTPPQRVFASIPLLFAIQQISEGFVWMGLSNPAFKGGLQLATFTFLIFAQIVWTLWIPLAMLLLEQQERRKKIIRGLLGAGVVLSIYHVWGLIVHPITGEALDCHIFYHVEYLRPYKMYSGFVYGVAAIIPCFVSSVKRMWWLGAAFLVSYVATQIIYTIYIISVWCFFAALLSTIVIFILNRMKTSQPGEVRKKSVL